MRLTCPISSTVKLHRNNTCYSKSDKPKQIVPTAAVSKADRRSPQSLAAVISSSPNTKHQCMFCRTKFEYSGGPQAVSLPVIQITSTLELNHVTVALCS